MSGSASRSGHSEGQRIGRLKESPPHRRHHQREESEPGSTLTKRRGATNMKTEFAFDICWEIYKGAREVLETKRGLYAFELSSSNEKYLWRPDLRPRLSEYVADFALAGARALEESKWASRVWCFRLYSPS